ncbi:DUF3397 domain-containing protein [Halobacillus salinarum]|uniref:DUF3397 domain-containing protein n=1 Tax=Halobacillus salinarum TaxID=2932257 RepID=A0ABY4EI27_9BACI|nr:DUF3397 domain-containing protein [Halobacillus salinarum]UOQ43142.1 DUF3397 domain-containing protein [Halobacillus salinarum]
MSDFIIKVAALVITLPIPFLILFYFFARKWCRHKRKAVHYTATITAPIFILAVHVLLFVQFERSFFAYIIIMLLCILSFSIIIQYKLHEEVRLGRAFKGFFRFSFLLFLIVYSGLSLFGLIERLFFT